MQHRFGDSIGQVPHRLCVSLEDLRDLIALLESTGLQLAGCDFEFPYNRSTSLHSSGEFAALDFKDLREVTRIFFSMEGTGSGAQMSLRRDQTASYSFYTNDKIKSYVLRGIFETFLKDCHNDSDECVGQIPTQSRPLKAVLTSAKEPSKDNVNFRTTPDLKFQSIATQNRPKTPKTSRWVAPAVIVGFLTLFVLIWQAVIASRGERNQTSNTTAQLGLEEAAIFKSTPLRTDLAPEIAKGQMSRNVLPFYRSIENVGRSPARNVHLRCGKKDEHGPYLDLGTIAVGKPYELKLELSNDPNDLLHSREELCFSWSFLIYDDNSGHHIISFDPAGNAVTERPDME